MSGNRNRFSNFHALTPYVGIDIRKELEFKNRIFSNNWDYYDGIHVLFYPKNMTPLKLQEGIIDAYQTFYSSSKIINHLGHYEIFYGLETLYVKYLFKKIIRQNYYYLEYLEKISKKEKKLR